MSTTLLAIGFFDSILLFMFMCVMCVVGGIVLLGKAAAAPNSQAQKLAGKAAGGAAKFALGQVIKGLRR